jgi:UDP-N-acetylglucosamine--N-acetylmuramyl-(pentapeptide) pyrophosphoryl-undecaprenol N-acetylglucosamine transferase
MKKILIAVSSTGGHIYPGLALAERLKKDGWEVYFAGKKSDVITKAGYKFFSIPASGLKRKLSPSIVVFALRFIASVIKSFVIFFKIKPDVAAGFGGYVSFPVIISAKFVGIPTLVHEQNAIPGLANKMSAPFADVICVSFPGSEKYFSRNRTVLTGNPVRASITGISAARACEPFTVLVFGGSQGAASINSAVTASLNSFRPPAGGIKFLHIAGRADFEKVKNAYKSAGLAAEVYEYVYDMEAVYEKASLAVCRAGATTIAELIALRLPAVLIPFPFATENHQKANADYLAGAGCAIVVEEKDIRSLAGRITGLAADPSALAGMSAAYSKLPGQDAAGTLAGIVTSLSPYRSN